MPAYLKIEGIKGESRDEGFKDEIDVLSWSWGETQTGTLSFGGGGGAGKVQMQDFHFTMLYNTASPKLFLACASGQHIPSALMSVRRAGERSEVYLKITLEDFIVSSYQTSGSGAGDAVPTDSFALNFTTIAFEYRPQDETGKLGEAVRARWDLSKGAGR